MSTLGHLHSSQSNVQVAKTSTQLKQHNRCETTEPWPVVHNVKGKTGIDKIKLPAATTHSRLKITASMLCLPLI